MFPLDRSLFRLLNRDAANGLLDTLMPVITDLHHRSWFLVIVGIAVVGLLLRGGPRLRIAVVCAVSAVVLSDLGSYRLIKQAIPRDRPCHVVRGSGRLVVPETRLVPGTHCPGSPSFPSSHASNMMAVAAVCWRFTRGRRRWIWVLLPLVIGYSRIYLGYHYPTDVLGGWALGALCAWLAVAMFGRAAFGRAAGGERLDETVSGPPSRET